MVRLCISSPSRDRSLGEDLSPAPGSDNLDLRNLRRWRSAGDAELRRAADSDVAGRDAVSRRKGRRARLLDVERAEDFVEVDSARACRERVRLTGASAGSKRGARLCNLPVRSAG